MHTLMDESAVEATTTFVEMVFPEQANHYGTLFGGNALNLMGKAAFVAATRRARQGVVMATSEKVEFHVPVRVGELVELSARVVRVGRASMTVNVDMIAETLHQATAVSPSAVPSRWSPSTRWAGLRGSDPDLSTVFSTARKEIARGIAYRTDVQIRRTLAERNQLAWKIAEVAADPVAVEPDVVEMIGNRISTTRRWQPPRSPGSRWQARGRRRSRIPASPALDLFGLPHDARISPEWAAWANGVAVRELDFHDTFLAADYSHPGDNIPPLLAVAPALRPVGCGPDPRPRRGV